VFGCAHCHAQRQPMEVRHHHAPKSHGHNWPTACSERRRGVGALAGTCIGHLRYTGLLYICDAFRRGCKPRRGAEGRQTSFNRRLDGPQQLYRHLKIELQANAEEEQADLRVSLIAGLRQSAAKVRNTYTGDQFDCYTCLKVIKCCRSGAEALLCY